MGLSQIIFLPFFLFLSLCLQASENVWVLTEGSLTYHLGTTLHDVDGVSSKVKGKGVCDGKHCEFLVASKIDSFNSGNENRDIHMLEVTKAGLFPMVTARANFEKLSKQIQAMVEIEFAGKKKEYKQSFEVLNNENKFQLKGVLPIKLSDFDIERPSFLGLKSDNELPIKIDLIFSEKK